MRQGALALVLAATVSVPVGADQSSIEWVPKYRDALKAARETQKILMLDFAAEWCEPCRAMDERVFPEPAIVSASKNFVFVRIDIDRDSATARQYRVHAVPTMIFIDPWETHIGQHAGFVDARQLREVLDAMPTDLRPLAPAYETLRETKDDYDALMAVAKFYDRPNLRHAAYAFYEKASKAPKAKSDQLAMDAAHIGMALAAINSGDPKTGEKIITKRMKACHPSNDGYLMLGLGTAYFHQKKHKEARATYEQVIARFPDSEPARLARENLRKMGVGE